MATKNSVILLGFILVSLLVAARSDDDHCHYVGICTTKSDCADPCQKDGYSPTAVICVPDPNWSGRGIKTCCCIKR